MIRNTIFLAAAFGVSIGAIADASAQDAAAPEPKQAPAAEADKPDVKKDESSDDNPANVSEAEARLAAETAFKELLSGATLSGSFTVDSEEPIDPTKLLKPDKYQLATVNKVKGDFWMFVYVHRGVPIPLTLKVLWAGKTPVLTLDEFTIAGMGTFSARVMFHGDRYAGTWQHGKKGGLMFGKIESPNAASRVSARPPEQVPLPQQNEPPVKDEE